MVLDPIALSLAEVFPAIGTIEVADSKIDDVGRVDHPAVDGATGIDLGIEAGPMGGAAAALAAVNR